MIAKRIAPTLNYLLLVVLALVVLYPLLFTVSSSFMTEKEVSNFPPPLFPSQLYLENFKNAISGFPIVRFILNSFIVSSGITVSQVITSSLAAYAFSFLNFKGKKILFAVFLSTMMIPWEVTIIPNYLTIKNWGWMDSYQGLIVPFMAGAFGVFLLRQFFLQLPNELFDAAKIDGCGHLRNFFSIVLPLSRPALSTLGVYVFLTHWNHYLWPLLITNRASMRTVQIGVSMLQHAEVMSWNLILAGVTIVLLPSFLLLALGVKQLVRGITAGAVKG
ncbi:carbohydrate ABC transporter permease [Paenibacillus alginolyticus]|jgi:sn-glycerol 3-phosphate transport system permease protein|uniref:ABC transporter permease subunit n=3 Tax=Paenibacillus TaxID=44249 RepID=A0ABX1ZBT0_9BACL|nr:MULTISPECIES: carbohydrate ABC transporter permease [Paenibacillus]MCY9667230.1 carbohydrate ABC transporter permease [Paenibacillus alginolyticus]MCY9692511.1 carbohydrate ABC transporter permease [Paenibacillus alginolyticus]MEC0144304.1 carbohydrate ABC transporter permease [Paenibacillus alginolyticus]NOU75888.1 ABC transporter permease subunit [Paenibacillus phytorum]NOU89315.1 ABC transporter permease subunit [Paenibacillus germinis]